MSDARKKRNERHICDLKDCGKFRTGKVMNHNSGDGSWRSWVCNQCIKKHGWENTNDFS